ncbi:MAG: sulfotransferase family 2 domain-containing protein, partial [Chthoniobacterales bacterium]
MSQNITEPTKAQGSDQPAGDRNGLARGSEEAVIFLHLPKTAGTTLNRLIEWEYPLSEMYSIDPVLFRWSAAHLRKLSPDRLKKTRMFKGHMLFGLHEALPQPATYITVLRDPVDRVLSAFYFMRSYKLHPLYWKM